ncbi:cob(I)yrinic acid a,c-diamide adenosyltransferase [Clostridium estertheticum]|uniref:Corrinoid adenosyltransferase n=1 Tax=Clostridium estertheticum subsp. estertheticum TaxID=1552 RepID=A0A1J0GF46_9CLOT|nr:cob(I)yrinic acid a,c-diamide adenosyltransferase [Clostridium estertheticum]APC39592.1 ATP:cob(I)alamin adenosyltransferase [Clostridium estertheticum subsp. estertheticum]MBU3072277.1 cob(I)yrinic acid a,c-diamide adenosyltransferase [Clostridium estertheticum]MBU3162369.1 cob(I)yrinic acid a,c-diamide adenosyltransferase [Clostridium estertheticum]MBZ9614376.1 cob(I)yrinic acid a,c-diamide adenosyltransferase [Clostridium estertheticum subsp. laramiense]WAG74311.1 cob(I)yrinic acid a,c-d
MKIYTKTGDKGQTSLLGGSRTSKSDLRVWSYGTCDSVNSTLGFARSFIKDEEIKTIIFKIQKTLFEAGAELASLGTDKFKERIVKEDIDYLETVIDKVDMIIPKLNSFIVPGGTIESGALDVARTKVREAERYIVELAMSYDVSANLSKYFNRLSDVIYTIARYEDYKNILIKVKENVIVALRLKINKRGSEKMNRELSEKIIKRCIEKAIQIEVPMVIWVMDEHGNPVMFERMDGSLLASIEIAKGKAYSAVAFKLPTHELNELAKNGELYGINNLDNVITFGGGYPLKINNLIVGAVGVSGGTVSQDMEVAIYAVKKFEEMISYGDKK